MRYILLRDDDTNALTPIECLETLYRPFLTLGLPVNLATIPEVRVDALTPAGEREGFLPRTANGKRGTAPLAENGSLIDYLHENPGLHVVQHGCHHDPFEFDCEDRSEVGSRLDRGRRQLRAAGFGNISTFVAPHDRFSRAAYQEAAQRYEIISTGWFELRRLPLSWVPLYLKKKLARRRHWRVGRTQLLSHPGCLLSHRQPLEAVLPAIKRVIKSQRVTVLVTHWWEYFRDGVPNEPFIRVLHETAKYLSENPELRVIPFGMLAQRGRQGATDDGKAPIAARPA